MNEKTIREKVQALIDQPYLSDYRISQETGLNLSSIQRIRSGVANLDNIKLVTAERLAAYHDREQVNFK